LFRDIFDFSEPLHERAHNRLLVKNGLDVADAYLKGDAELDVLIRGRFGEGEPTNLLIVYQYPPRWKHGPRVGPWLGVESVVAGLVGYDCNDDEAVLIDVIQVAEPDEWRSKRVLASKVRLYLFEQRPALAGDTPGDGRVAFVAVPVNLWGIPNRERRGLSDMKQDDVVVPRPRSCLTEKGDGKLEAGRIGP
jgi:hypothetical protein